MTTYGRGFYEKRHRKTVHSARTILGIVQEALPGITSGVDVGCGVGTWLRVLKDMGASRVQGLDGGWVDRDLLEIPGESFLEHDLNEPVRLDGRFDLAISLEVAEHVRPASAGTFVQSLVDLSDFVLFSAAVPSQRGVGHVNEQWPDYWIALFAERGYVGLDFVRKRIWNDEKVTFMYRQNVLLFARAERVADLKIGDPRDAIPGETYLLTFRWATHPGIRLSLSYLLAAVGSRVNSLLR